jgi:hypothetical protein
MPVTKEPSMYVRLLDNHPTMIKLMKLYDLAVDLGITISFSNYSAVIADSSQTFPNMNIEDIDDGTPISEWPPSTEFKVLHINPKWQALQEKKEEERKLQEKEKLEQQQARDAKNKSERAKKEAEVKRLRAIQVEKEERELLANLKKKYEA